jgi:hypothetical protein
VRERSLPRLSYQQAKRHLLEDLADAAVINLTGPLLATCTTVVEASPVRAMDALHLVCAVEWKAEMFVSADRRPVAAARRLGCRRGWCRGS